MPLPEIEFELPAQQFALMEYPTLQQGQPLTLALDGGILLPDPVAPFWFAVQKEPLPRRFTKVGPAIYAFSGPIEEAEIEYGDEQMAYLSVDCGSVSLRVACGPEDDGMLPYGTWETRHIAGIAAVQGLVEENFHVGVGRNVNVTIWHFRRLVLTPGDPNFGQWHETVELPSTPFAHDRIFVTARLHRQGV